ncbi:MAG TPA: hypothetical protein VFG74_16110 [Miltoncostaeaceae bacterium]|nr:hypothetical protein [Miltoncostaeaceae bacterium]
MAVAAALLLAVAASAFVRSGGGGPPPMAAGAAAAAAGSAVAAAGPEVVAAGPGIVGVVRLARYRAALRLGRQGRFPEARAAMLALGGFRNAPAAARSFSVRAGQAMLAEARRIRTRRPARARALVRDAARVAPWLTSLPRVRALVRRGP